MFGFAETGNRRLLTDLEPLFSVFLVIYLLNYRQHPWTLHAIKCLHASAMHDFATYYCRW